MKRLLLILLILSIISSCKEEITEPKDTEAPDVIILFPADKAKINEDDGVVIKVDAEDKSEIEKVEFYIDGSLTAEDNAKPYEHEFNTEGKIGTHTLLAKAYDSFENVGSSNVITIEILEGNKSPITPNNPQPINNAVDVNIGVELSWSASDPEGDTLKYDVYFGTNPTPATNELVAIGIEINSYHVNNLEYNTLYYWKVVAKDNNGGETESPIWSFTTFYNETLALVNYLEANGNPLNNFAVMTKASTVHTNIIIGADQYIIDIRSASDFAAGHIQGAINVNATDVLMHYEVNNLDSKEVVVIVDYTGQTAGWVTGLMHTVGYTNVRDLKWGMCSWNSATSDPWVNNISNSYASQLIVTSTPKSSAGELPKLQTGLKIPEQILRARVEAIFEEGFSATKMNASQAFENSNDYYIINYLSVDHYNWGHIPGAIQYTPKTDLVYSTYLKTLPVDKIVAVYDYTGQTSAQVTAYLRVLGYDAKSILFGMNAMAYDTMPGTRFVSETEVHDFQLVQ
jgi:rhodanese-related sulfurtransferase